MKKQAITHAIIGIVIGIALWSTLMLHRANVKRKEIRRAYSIDRLLRDELSNPREGPRMWNPETQQLED